MKQILILFLPFLFLSSCISNKKILKNTSSECKEFSIDELNGNYAVSYVGSDSESDPNLWRILYNCAPLKKDTVYITQDVTINLQYDGVKTLSVTAQIGDNIISSFDYKCKLHNNYISVRRKVHIVPIPFFFIYEESKILLGLHENGNLLVKSGYDQFLWVVMVGGQSGVSEYEFRKVD